MSLALATDDNDIQTPSQYIDISAKGGNMDQHQQPLEKIYQKKTQLEHILLRPDSYIGSTESREEAVWVLS
jgi:DNA topoisomerase-2